jgi:hypothetical protein
MFRIDYTPLTAAWIHQGKKSQIRNHVRYVFIGSDVIQAIAISDLFTPIIRVYDGKGADTVIKIIDNIHSKPAVIIEVSHMLYLLNTVNGKNIQDEKTPEYLRKLIFSTVTM